MNSQLLPGYSSPKPHGPPVTIVIGFSTDRLLVVASDSQLSYWPDTRKQPDVQKVFCLKTADGRSVLMAKAGSARTADYFHEFFETNLLATKSNTPRAIADAAEASMLEARNRTISAFSHPALGGEALQHHLRDYYSEILIAYSFKHEPFIYALTLANPNAVRKQHNFEAIGCAANLASFVVTGFDLKTLSHDESIAVAVHAVELCKEHDSACGGKTQVGVINTKNECGAVMDSPSLVFFVQASHFTTLGMQKHLIRTLKSGIAKTKEIIGKTLSE